MVGICGIGKQTLELEALRDQGTVCVAVPPNGISCLESRDIDFETRDSRECQDSNDLAPVLPPVHTLGYFLQLATLFGLSTGKRSDFCAWPVHSVATCSDRIKQIQE